MSRRQPSPTLTVGTQRNFYLEVPDRSDVLGALNALSVRHRRETALSESLEGDWVVSEVELGADEEYGYARCVMGDLRVVVVWSVEGWSTEAGAL
jgi:hypothetical protein